METIESRKPDLRTRHCAAFLTDEDADNLERFAKASGFTSRGQLITAILERLLVSGFSPLGFLKLGIQLSNFARRNGNQGTGFYFGVRPLPALPEEHISDALLKNELAAISQLIEKKAQ